MTSSHSIGSVDETQRRGDLVIHALDKYYADRGEYPATLTELSPEYLKNIPCVDETNRTGDGDSKWLRYYGPKLGWQMGD